MKQAIVRPAGIAALDARLADFYRQVLRVLNAAAVPFMVGGGYAWGWYTGRARDAKDLDLFLCRHDYERAAEALARAGLYSELSFPHWLAKVFCEDSYIDLIFGSGNGVCTVDEVWLAHAPRAKLLGAPVRICPVEEMIWSKAFVMERERYDGADVAHLLSACARRMDWERLLLRFGEHWRVLLSHLVLFGFIYPDERALVPAWLMEELLARLGTELGEPVSCKRLCGGTLLSREQYLEDIEAHGCVDARLAPHGALSAQEIELWTRAIPERGRE